MYEDMLNRIYLELKEVRSEIKDMRIAQERDFIRKSEVYGKGELDRVFNALTDNQQSLEKLIAKHAEDDTRDFAEVKTEIVRLREDDTRGKESVIDRVTTFAIHFTIFLLGTAAMWVGALLTHKK